MTSISFRACMVTVRVKADEQWLGDRAALATLWSADGPNPLPSVNFLRLELSDPKLQGRIPKACRPGKYCLQRPRAGRTGTTISLATHANAEASTVSASVLMGIPESAESLKIPRLRLSQRTAPGASDGTCSVGWAWDLTMKGCEPLKSPWALSHRMVEPGLQQSSALERTRG